MSRRTFVGASSLLGVGLASAGAAAAARPVVADDEKEGDAWAVFPQQPAALVSAVVGASHRSHETVREMVTARPALAKAAWDWGFGDWESALGAASHTGQREIALFLIEHGARPDVFTFAMLGNIAAVRGMLEAAPGLIRLPGPHGISLLRHALAGGDQAAEVAAYLGTLADAEAETAQADAAGRAVYTGVYRISAPVGIEFEIKEFRESLVFQRGERPRLRLIPLGEHGFAPVGAEHVRMVFEVAEGGQRATGVTIRDGDPEIRAERVG